MKRRNKNHFLKTLLPLAFPGLLLAACAKEETALDAGGSCFSLVLEEEGGSPTKSLLQSADIETRITSVTLGLYQGGALVDSQHFGSGFDQMVFPLEDGVYTAYALVNMGDMREALPEAEADLPSLSYSIPGYLESGTGIEYRGIPMAGLLSYTVGVSVSGAIPVKRLMAKVTANLSCEWTGAITSVQVFNLNRTLKPFGTSAAASAGDILPVQEYQAGGDLSSGTFVFYVPENLQGSVSGIPTSAEKSPEGNAEVNGRQGLMTYLETLVTGTSGVEGTIKYRSYLGADATGDFDIRRNWRYTWDIRFLPDGRLNNDWKHENSLSWSEFRYSITPAYLYLYEGETGTIKVNRNEDRYENGTFHANAGATQTYGSHFSWSYASSQDPSVQNDNAVITGNLSGNNYNVYVRGTGTRRVTAVGPDGSNEASLFCDVTAMNYRRQILMVADPGPRAAVGGSIRLKVLVYTTQNGVTTGGSDVSTSSACSIFRGSAASYNPLQMNAQGVVTASSAGRERFNADYNYPGEGKRLHASGLYLIFENSRTGDLSISGNGSPGKVGKSLQLQASFSLYNNGNPNSIASTTGVTNQVSWSVQDGSAYGLRVSSSGVVTSTQPCAGVIQATYTASNGLDYQAQAIVLFNR